MLRRCRTSPDFMNQIESENSPARNSGPPASTVLMSKNLSSSSARMLIFAGGKVLLSKRYAVSRARIEQSALGARGAGGH